MNMKTTVTITKFSDSFGDLENMKPSGYGTNQILEGELPFENGVPMQNPETQKDRDLWNRSFLALFDVPMPSPTDWGLSLKLVSNPGEADRYHIEYGNPAQLETPRNFSIEGAVVADPESFDGTADVILQTFTTQPQDSLPYARQDQDYVRTVSLEPQDAKVYGRQNDVWVDLTTAVFPPDLPIVDPAPFPPIDDIQNNSFIEYRIATPLTINLTVENLPKIFHIYAQAEAIEFTGAVIALNDGSLVLPHGAVATVKKLSTGEYLVIGNTAIP